MINGEILEKNMREIVLDCISVGDSSTCGWAGLSVHNSQSEKTEPLSCDNNVPLFCNHL